MFTRLISSPEFENNDYLQTSPWSVYPWIGLIAGISVLGFLYFQASQAQVAFLFERFWLGILLFYIPAFWRQMSSRVSRYERLALLIAITLFSYAPKLFRCPTFFCYFDELTWWRGIQDLLGGSQVLTGNPLGLVQGLFPGLPLITIFLQKASGLSTFQSGLVLIGFIRLFSLVSMFFLGEIIFHSSKVGAIAAMIYTVNANFFFFDTQFNYESLSVPLLISTLVLLLYLLYDIKGRKGIAWRITIFINILAIILTHHLTTYMMIALFMIMVGSSKLLPRFTRFKSPRQLDNIALFSLVASLSWLIFVAIYVILYIGIPISRGIEQMAAIKVRPLFGGISLPGYEVISGFLSAILIVALALLGSFLIYSMKKKLHAAHIGLLAFGSLYFATAPLVLTSWGAEGGRRSWTYSFISLALLSGFALVWFLESDSFLVRKIGELYSRIIATAIFVVLLIGGIASSTSISYRFPGEYLLNSDARSFTPEIINAAQWILSQAGPHNRVLGDRTSERIFGSYGLQDPAMYDGPRPWAVFLPTSWTDDALYWLDNARAPFIVVDKRMAELPPQLDFRFQNDEPKNAYSSQPLPVESVTKFDTLPQLDRIYDSGNIRIYHLNNGDKSNLNNKQLTENIVKNPINTDSDSEILFPGIINLLFIFFRSILVIPLLLVIPGYVIGDKLFPNWINLEVSIRLLLAAAISVSIIVFATFTLAFILSNVENAVLIVLFVYGLLILIGVIQLLMRVKKNQSSRGNSLSNIEPILNKVWPHSASKALILGVVSIVLIVLFMGLIKPMHESRTDFMLDFSSVLPTVRVFNHEDGVRTYELKLHNNDTGFLFSQTFQLKENQTIEINFLKSPTLIPLKGRIVLDLFIDGHKEPYRSLHFLNEALPK